MQKAIVIGAGIAGIASALRLRHKGYAVEVYEANDFAGGKLHAFYQDGFRFDMGPSLFTMPHLVDELFALFDVPPQTQFKYKRKDTVCNYFWEDGTTFSAAGDEQKFINQASQTFETPRELIAQYLKSNKEKYDLTADIFLKKSLHKWNTYISYNTLKSLVQAYKLDINTSLNQVNKQYFDSPKLIQLFNRYATYNGSSPFVTPGIMSMIPHLEMHYGTFFPEGGMHQISQSLYHLAEDVGINFHFETPVDEVIIENKEAIGIRVNGEKVPADMIVSNMDVFNSYEKLLNKAEKPKKILKQERSSSAIIFYWGIDKEFPTLDLHNILFSEHYQEEFQAIFESKTLHKDPTVYINITSKDAPADAPKGCENWFVMVNAPANFGQDWDALIRQAKRQVLDKITQVLGENIEPLIISESILDPVKIEQLTSSHRGSLYGTSSNSKFAAFLRHPNFSSKYKNLFFCGGSVHPGGGIPLCLLSAKITTELIPTP